MNNYNSSRNILKCIPKRLKYVTPTPVNLTEVRRMISKKQIIAVVETVSGFTLEQLKVKTRKRPMVYARYCMMCFLRSRAEMTLHQIGDLLGMDHSTCIYGIRIADNLIKYDPAFKLAYRKIERML